MNGGILNTARPSQKHDIAKLPNEALAMARQMGLSSDDIKQMEGMWKNMDDLASQDPVSYQAFINENLKNGPPKDERSSSRSFSPFPHFVVKTKLVGEGSKCFLNLCSHKAVERPHDPMGNLVQDGEYRSAQGLQIPLLVGQLRQCDDHNGLASWAVDVVFHPWVMWRCDPHGGKSVGGDDGSLFKAQIIDLALTWVSEETKHRDKPVVFDPKFRWKTIKSRYKAGDGPNRDKPIPFPVDAALDQERPCDERKVEETQDTVVETPHDLLQSLRSQNFQQSQSLDTTGPASAPLVESINSQQERKPKKGEAIKSGFLNKKSSTLYGDDGSSNGSLEGSYSRFMSKCKIVDTSKMTSEQQQAAMRTHAVPQEQVKSTSGSQASNDQPVRKDEFSGMDKGFLRRGTRLGGNLQKKDDLFDSLISSIDPDYAEATKPSEDVATKDAFEQLSELASVLSATTTTKAESSPSSSSSTSVRHTPISVSRAEGSQKQSATTTFSFDPGQSPENIVLEVGDGHALKSYLRFKLTAEALDEILIPLPFRADNQDVKAKLKRREGRLRVTVVEK